MKKLRFFIAAMAGVISLVMGQAPALAQADATGRAVVSSTLAKSSKGEISSGSLNGTIAGFLAKNAGRNIDLHSVWAGRDKRLNQFVYVYYKLRFEADGSSAVLYSSTPLYNAWEEHCRVSSTTTSSACVSQWGGVTSASINIGGNTLKIEPTRMILYYSAGNNSCTPTVSESYLYQDAIDAGRGFTGNTVYTAGVCYTESGGGTE